jgi:hypothetical protein
MVILAIRGSTRSIGLSDHDKLAAYMHKASFKTVSGDFSFGEDGEWSKSRMVWTQVQSPARRAWKR